RQAAPQARPGLGEERRHRRHPPHREEMAQARRGDPAPQEAARPRLPEHAKARGEVMPNPFESIPPRIRQGLYLAYALVGLGLAVAAVYGVDVSQHVSALAVVGAAFGFTAAANTPAKKQRHRDPGA